MSWLRRWFERKPVRAVPVRDEPDEVEESSGCSHDQAEIEQRIGTPDFDLFVAEGELEIGGNLKHGAHHLACLLLVDPSRPDWRQLADRYVAKAGSRLDRLIPETAERYAATEALRAYFWHAQGRVEEALRHLVGVTEAMHDKRYLDAWAHEWLAVSGAVEALPPDLILRLLGYVVTRAPEPHKASLPQLRMAERWADLACRALPGELSGLQAMFKAGLLRKAARYEEALVAVGPLAQSDENQAMARGLVLRRLNRPEESQEAFARAIELSPGNESPFLEVGDTWFDLAQWQHALTWYEGALAVEADQPWAKASAAFCHWKLEGGEARYQQFIELAREGNGRARQIWYAHFDALPQFHDATANCWRQMRSDLAKAAPGRPEGDRFEFKLGFSALEAPSNRLAIALDCTAAGKAPAMEISVDAIPSPDPRVPLTTVDYLLWRYDGTTPFAAVDPPREAISERIAAMARKRYSMEANCAEASFAAAELGVEAIGDLLAVMLHPPAVPEDDQALAWVPRIQLTAALVLAQIDQGWDISERRKALYSMLFGPSDWITGAAIRALAWIAQTEQAHAMDIHEQFLFLERQIPDMGGCCRADILYDQWRHLPFQSDAERERYEKRLQELSE
ncbi:hypothetical protein [Labrys neptuniae]|uniref:Tetratricopeptide repeat protein n=1 Tax=Labrys neptuniae TaxID=376174 RepID=A0ABV3PP68_9HYPH